VTKNAPKKAWTKPELERMGRLKDVAGPTPPGSQGSSGKT
jgi:hypothetical protein